MNLHPHLCIPAEESVDAFHHEKQASKRAASLAHKISTFIAVILCIGFLGVLSVADLNIPLLDGVILKQHVDEKTFYSPRGNSQGDQYLLGVGKADITGFVHHH
jgi:hypothetical protein